MVYRAGLENRSAARYRGFKSLPLRHSTRSQWLTCSWQAKRKNMAKRGDNTRDLLRRFDEDVAAKKPDVLSVCIGANDAVCAGYMVFLNIITVTGI